MSVLSADSLGIAGTTNSRTWFSGWTDSRKHVSMSDWLIEIYYFRQELFFDEIYLEIIIFDYLNREYFEEVFIQETEIFGEIDKYR